MSEELRALLNEFYTPSEVDVWLRSPQPLFNDRIAADMIADGDEAKLIRALQAMSEGVYL